MDAKITLPEDKVVSSILSVIDKLPHSRSRVPWTYHHDYLRQHCEKFKGNSRNEVAHKTNYIDSEVYSIALIELLNELGSDAIWHLRGDDILICKKAKAICDAAISRYNTK